MATARVWRQDLSKNAHSVITDPLPSIFYKAGFTTTSNAMHPLHFSGTLGKWDDFVLNVLKCHQDLTEKGLWKSTETPMWHGRYGGDNPTDTNGVIQCGMEITVSGRFEELC